MLNRVVNSLVRTLEKSNELTLLFSYPIAPHESVANDASKLCAITKLLSENPTLLKSIANPMYFGNEGESKAVKVFTRAISSQEMKYAGLAVSADTNKGHLNNLFTVDI